MFLCDASAETEAIAYVVRGKAPVGDLESYVANLPQQTGRVVQAVRKTSVPTGEMVTVQVLETIQDALGAQRTTKQYQYLTIRFDALHAMFVEFPVVAGQEDPTPLATALGTSLTPLH